MAEDNTQPIIVKKIKKSSHGHHGGAWKIAYADFVTAMMAFFLLMWILGSTTDEQKSAISDYFNNPSAVAGPGGASTSLVKVGGGKDITYSAGDTKQGSNPDKKPKAEQPPPTSEVGRITQEDKQRLLDLKKELEQAIDASEALKPFKDQLLLEITKEGLRIQIIDKENRPMFASGSAVLQPYAEQIIKEIGKVITHVPNRISLSGHTDATPFSKLPGARYSNWELSADRSNASRRALIDGGMDEGKVARVVGLSSFVLFDKQNPLNPVNRRISIIVLNKETEDAILHDEGKLEQTTAESSDTSKSQASTPLPENKPATVEKTPEKPVVPATTPIAPSFSTPAPVPAPAPSAKPQPPASNVVTKPIPQPAAKPAAPPPPAIPLATPSVKPQPPASNVVTKPSPQPAAKPATTTPPGISFVAPPISTPVTAISLVPNVQPVSTPGTTGTVTAPVPVTPAPAPAATVKPAPVPPAKPTPSTTSQVTTVKPAPASAPVAQTPVPAAIVAKPAPTAKPTSTAAPVAKAKTTTAAPTTTPAPTATVAKTAPASPVAPPGIISIAPVIAPIQPSVPPDAAAAAAAASAAAAAAAKQ